MSKDIEEIEKLSEQGQFRETLRKAESVLHTQVVANRMAGFQKDDQQSLFSEKLDEVLGSIRDDSFTMQYSLVESLEGRTFEPFKDIISEKYKMFDNIIKQKSAGLGENIFTSHEEVKREEAKAAEEARATKEAAAKAREDKAEMTEIAQSSFIDKIRGSEKYEELQQEYGIQVGISDANLEAMSSIKNFKETLSEVALRLTHTREDKIAVRESLNNVIDKCGLTRDEMKEVKENSSRLAREAMGMKTTWGDKFRDMFGGKKSLDNAKKILSEKGIDVKTLLDNEREKHDAHIHATAQKIRERFAAKSPQVAAAPRASSARDRHTSKDTGSRGI